MSSGIPRSNALTTSSIASSRPVSWQVDIPGLANLVARAGAEGLKQLALAGVDIHTIGCMLALGELTPASIEFRTRMQKQRREQQSQSWWLHAIVEYGAGTNFVVDELIKTRAGENVLALLTAIIPVLEDGAIEVLNMLFEKMNAPMHSTPSIGQLEAIRSTCLPLARRMDFKDRLAELHHWLLFQFMPRKPSYFDPRQAIPDSATIVELVKTLCDIAMQDKGRRSKLAFYGTRGTAWLILYAGSILGLLVCLVHRDGSTHPISGTYSSADVLLFPEGSDTSEVLQYIDHPSDIIAVTCNESSSLSQNWLLSCDEAGVDFFKLFCGWDMGSRQEIGNVIYSIATEYIDRRIGITRETPESGLYKYYGQDMASKYDTLRQILHLLGLPNQFTRNKAWREQYFLRHATSTGEARIDLELRLFSFMIRHVDQEPHPYCSHVRLQPSELSHLPSYCPRCTLFEVTREMAYFSSCLVFSDWHRSFRKISVRRLMPGADDLAQTAHSLFRLAYADDQHGIADDVRRNLLRSDRDERVVLAQEVAQICSESRYAYDLIRSHKHKFLGINVDGVLLIEYRAIEPSLQEGPRLILCEGEFRLSGDRRPLLVTSDHSSGASSYNCAVNTMTILQPFDHFQGGALSVRAALRKDAIEMHYTFAHEGENEGNFRDLEVDVPVLDIITGLPSLLVSERCEHGYQEPLAVSKVQIGADSDDTKKITCWKDPADSLWHIQDTLYTFLTSAMPDSAQGNHLSIFQLYPVENNRLGQWVSVAFAQKERKRDSTNFGLTIFQRQACLGCIRDRAKQILNNEPYRPEAICIIAGGAW
jgi:hypothetical protein